MKVYLVILLCFPELWPQITSQQNSPMKMSNKAQQEFRNRKAFQGLIAELKKLQVLIDSSQKSDFDIISKLDVGELTRIVEQSVEGLAFLDSVQYTDVPPPSFEYLQSIDRKADQIAHLDKKRSAKTKNIGWFRAMRDDILVKTEHAERLPLTPFGDILVEVTTFFNNKPAGIFEVYFVCDDYKASSAGNRFNNVSDEKTGKTSRKIAAGVYQLYTVAMNERKTRGDMKELVLGKGMQNVSFDLPAKD